MLHKEILRSTIELSHARAVLADLMAADLPIFPFLLLQRHKSFGFRIAD